MIRVNDKVNINDGSYSIKVTSKGLEHGPGGDKHRGESRKVYTVLLTNCVFPNTGSRAKTFNNIVIQNDETGEVIFIEERFLQLAEYEITIAGKVIKISPKSYENLKKQLT